MPETADTAADVKTVLCYDGDVHEAILKTAEVPGVERPTRWLRIDAESLAEVSQ